MKTGGHSDLRESVVYGYATGYYGTGVKAESTGDEGAALYAYATGASGIAVSAKNESSSRAAIVARDYVGSPLIDAYNGSGSADRVFQVTSDGMTSVDVLHIAGGECQIHPGAPGQVAGLLSVVPTGRGARGST